MSTVGQIEKRTQQRVVTLFREQLGYDYLGDWTEREGDRNIEGEPQREKTDRGASFKTQKSRAFYWMHALDV